jgi:hypothetical protein
MCTGFTPLPFLYFVKRRIIPCKLIPIENHVTPLFGKIETSA